MFGSLPLGLLLNSFCLFCFHNEPFYLISEGIFLHGTAERGNLPDFNLSLVSSFIFIQHDKLKSGRFPRSVFREGKIPSLTLILNKGVRYGKQNKQTKSSVSAWFSSKPEGNRPNISAMIELTPEIVATIVRNGEIGSHEMIQLRLMLVAISPITEDWARLAQAAFPARKPCLDHLM